MPAVRSIIENGYDRRRSILRDDLSMMLRGEVKVHGKIRYLATKSPKDRFISSCNFVDSVYVPTRKKIVSTAEPIDGVHVTVMRQQWQTSVERIELTGNRQNV